LHEVDGIVYMGSCASGMVDGHLKAFLDRTWGMAHRPSLKGKYGFAVATGGGPLGKNAAWYNKKNKMFDYLSTGGSATIIKILFKN